MGALSSCFPLRPGLAACDETVATTPRPHLVASTDALLPMCMGSWGAVGLHLGLAKLFNNIKTMILTGTAEGGLR